MIGFPSASCIHPAPRSTGFDNEVRSVCVRPPIRSRASTIVTLNPLATRALAADAPDIPAPIIITEGDALVVSSSFNLSLRL